MKNPKQYEMMVDFITLWKAIHGGDYGPEAVRLTAGLAIYNTAAKLKGGAQIKAAAAAFLQKELGAAR